MDGYVYMNKSRFIQNVMRGFQMTPRMAEQVWLLAEKEDHRGGEPTVKVLFGQHGRVFDGSTRELEGLTIYETAPPAFSENQQTQEHTAALPLDQGPRANLFQHIRILGLNVCCNRDRGAQEPGAPS